MPKRTDIHTILIPGSGPIVIGQAAEFDYSGTQAVKALRALPSNPLRKALVARASEDSCQEVDISHDDKEQ